MKHIQITDGAQNCTFSIFQATDEEFLLLFPQPEQDLQYAEDIFSGTATDARRYLRLLSREPHC